MKILATLLLSISICSPCYSEESVTGLKSLDQYSKELCSTYTSDSDAEENDNMGALPLCYIYGFHREIDLEKAKDIYLARAERRPWNYARAAGVVFHEIKQANQYPDAVLWLKLGAKNGDATADCYLSLLYLTGRVVNKDLELAETHLSKARNKGDATCILISYYLYTTGEYNFKKNLEQANEIESWVIGTSPYLKSKGAIIELFPRLDSYINTFGAEWK